MADFSIKQEQNDRTIYSICYFNTRGERRATIRVIREEDRVHDHHNVKGTKEESGDKKVDQF